MKKIGVLFSVILLFGLFSNFVYAQDLSGIEEGLESAEEKLDKAREFTEEDKWDYLSKEWKNILLKNKIVSVIDSFCKKINFVFVALFGEGYDLSLTLFFIIILWFYFFFKLSEILTDYSTFSSAVAAVIGFGLVLILAQLKVLRQIVELFGWFVFSQEAWWLRLIIFIVIVFILIFLYKLSSQVGQSFKEHSDESREEMEKTEEKINRGIIKSFADTIVKSLK